MRVLLAIVRDTLLALRRRRLFWLHLWLSAAVVLLYAGIVCHDSGWSIGFGLKRMDSAWLKHGTPWEGTLHCWTLARIMRWWVAGGAVFLSLFATAAVLPETLEPGSAALLVPRARHRSLILAGRFVGSLLYAMLHTVLIVGGLWLAFRWRMGTWYHGFWLAVPVAALLFAPLQAVAMLLGVLTRSATAALLVAILFAGSVWAIQEAATVPADDAAPAFTASREDENASGFSDAIAGEAALWAGVLMPNPRNALVWLEHNGSPQPSEGHPYRELFRRLRIGRGSFGAAAADVIAAASVPVAPKKEKAAGFAPLLWSSAGFTVACMVLAAWLLKRRDL
jgi:ABC-type transport system involved in multi-copper enzyme maturation permease subunit